MRLKREQYVWWPYLQDCIAAHNASYSHSTRYKIARINESNYLDFLQEKRRNNDVELVFNAYSWSQRGLRPKSWVSKLWRYKIGDRVVLSRSSAYSYEVRQQKYLKKSVHGSYANELFVVKDAYLRKSWSSPKISVPVYKVSRQSIWPNTAPIDGYFYESELALHKSRAEWEKLHGAAGGVSARSPPPTQAMAAASSEEEAESAREKP